MTNVPQPIRDAWVDLYKLFDISFNMDGSEKAWIEYWDKANVLIKKYGDDIPLLTMLEAIAHFIAFFAEGRKPKSENESLTWKADEPYPYPKD